MSKSFRTIVLGLIVSSSIGLADPMDYMEGVDRSGWATWTDTATDKTYHSPGPLVLDLSEGKPIDWLIEQSEKWPDSRLIAAETASRLTALGRDDEAAKYWLQAKAAPDSDFLVQAAHYWFLQKQWGKAFEHLQEAGPGWFKEELSAFAQDPVVGFLFRTWTATKKSSLEKDGRKLVLSSPGRGNWQSLQLGAEQASIDREKGWLYLHSKELQLAITPLKAVDKLAGELAGTGSMKETLGTSVEGKNIDAYSFGQAEETVLFFGAFHGDEPESAELLNKLVAHLQDHPELFESRRAVIVPVVNPDGLSRGQRRNAREVDLNRNYPTSNWNSEGKGSNYWGGPKPLSEPETKIVVELIKRIKPARIISVHAPYRCVNYDGPAKSLAELLSKENGYKVEANIGYPTPGSFGNYAGVEGKIPTITLELPPENTEDVWADNRQALVRALRGVEKP